MDTATPNQALEKPVARTPAVITTPEEFRGSLSKWQNERYNVLSPFTNMAGLAPSFGLMATVVKLDPNPAAGEVYAGVPWLKGDEVSPAKIGLRKLAECGGISTDSERLDRGERRYYWSFKGIAQYRGLDGSIVRRTATFEWDLSDGSDRLKGWTPKQVEEGRKHGLRNCEARAINAAIRECGCGIKQKYSKAELERPFVVVRVSFMPDMSDPAVKQMVTERALHGTSTLYGGRELGAGNPHGAIDAEHEAVTDEPRAVGRSTTTAPAKSEPPKDERPADYAVRIVDVKSVSGTTNRRNWTKYVVVDDRGEEHGTFDQKIAEYATNLKGSPDWYEIVEEPNGQHKNIIEILKFGEQPDLPGVARASTLPPKGSL